MAIFWPIRGSNIIALFLSIDGSIKVGQFLSSGGSIIAIILFCHFLWYFGTLLPLVTLLTYPDLPSHPR